MLLSSRFSAGCLLLAAVWGMLGAVAHAEQAFYIPPHLNNITQDSVTLIWESKEPEVGVVAYGTDATLGMKASGETEATIHRVRVTGLKAESTYHYEVRCGDDVQKSTFTTAPATARPITFVLIGDSRRWSNRWEETKMQAHAAQWKPEFYLTMGDLVPNGHTYEQWPEHFDRFKTLTDHLWMVTARGNHEGSQIFDPEQDWFAQYHELPGDGEPFADFTWGNTHFSLISFEQTAGAATVEWLDKNLPEQDAQWKIAAHHFPVYCTGYASPNDKRKEMGTSTFKPLADALDRHNVTLDLAGHTHIYERLHSIRAGKRDDEKGTLYLVNGGDIGANYPDWFTAVNDHGKPYDQPTYTVFHMGDDRVWFRTFCWSKETEAIIEIDYHVIWRDEAVPQSVMAKLDGAEGEALREAVVELGGMSYLPAAPKLVAFLSEEDPALRQAAATAIRQIGSATVSESLLPYLNDADLHVRREIARALEIAMDPTATETVVATVRDSGQDSYTRVALIGALHFHGDPEAATQLYLDLLKATDTAAAIRERAAYGLTRTVAPEQVETVFALFREETAPYVLARLGFTLNELTGRIQNVDPKSPLGRSKPGEGRDKYIKKWRDWMEKQQAKEKKAA